MKLEIDLNKLSLKELETVLQLAKKDCNINKEEIKIEEVKTKEVLKKDLPIKKYSKKTSYFKRRAKIIEPKIQEIFNENKIVSTSKLNCLIFNYPSGKASSILSKYILIALKNLGISSFKKGNRTYWVKNIQNINMIHKKKDKNIERLKWIHQRINTLKNELPYANYEELFRKASFEHQNKCKIGNANQTITPFNYNLIVPELPQQVIKGIIKQGFNQTNFISMFDFNNVLHIDIWDDISLKIMNYEKEILEDLNIIGKLKLNIETQRIYLIRKNNENKTI
jgi:hypothetical protein